MRPERISSNSEVSSTASSYGSAERISAKSFVITKSSSTDSVFSSTVSSALSLTLSTTSLALPEALSIAFFAVLATADGAALIAEIIEFPPFVIEETILPTIPSLSSPTDLLICSPLPELSAF